MVLILAILGLAVGPSLTSVLPDHRLKAGAGELADALAHARILAVTHERAFGVEIDVGGNWFRVFDNTLKNDSKAHHEADPPVDENGLVLHPISKDWYQKDFDESSAAAGVEITAGPAAGEILFYPDGHTSSDADETCTLESGDQSLDLTIRAVTGRIVIR